MQKHEDEVILEMLDTAVRSICNSALGPMLSGLRGGEFISAISPFIVSIFQSVGTPRIPQNPRQSDECGLRVGGEILTEGGTFMKVSDDNDALRLGREQMREVEKNTPYTPTERSADKAKRSNHVMLEQIASFGGRLRRAIKIIRKSELGKTMSGADFPLAIMSPIILAVVTKMSLPG